MAYDAEKDEYTCAQGQKLREVTVKNRNLRRDISGRRASTNAQIAKIVPSKKRVSGKRKRTKHHWKTG